MNHITFWQDLQKVAAQIPPRGLGRLHTLVAQPQTIQEDEVGPQSPRASLTVHPRRGHGHRVTAGLAEVLPDVNGSSRSCMRVVMVESSGVYWSNSPHRPIRSDPFAYPRIHSHTRCQSATRSGNAD